MDAKIVKRGDSIAQLIIQDVNIDIYVATPETWGTMLLIRTGPKEHNIKLSGIALRKGMNLAHSGLIKDGKIIASLGKEIFESLGLSYVEPEER